MDNILYIYMDESGLINKNEKVAVYGGIWFKNKKDRDNLNRQFKTIIKDINCYYCNDVKLLCNNDCPEVKNFNISKSHRRRINNLLKKQYGNYAIIIDNSKIKQEILADKSSRGRYKDYIMKIIVKEICKKASNLNYIDINKKLTIILNIDQQPTISNGYYDLKDSITKELVNGIYNYNNSYFFSPLLKGGLDIQVSYLDSKYNTLIQIADFIVGSSRRYYLNADKSELNKYLKLIRYEPRK